MSRAKRSQLLAQPLLRWLTGVDGLVRFQASYLDRVTDYAKVVGDLTEKRSIDPGEWIQDYASFMRQVIDDLGDWMLEREPRARDASASVALYSGLLKQSEGTTAVPLRVPMEAFEGRSGRNGKLTLTTDGLLPRGGGTQVARSHVRFVPATVDRSNRRTKLVVFDVREAVRKGGVYAGVVWAEETKRPVAAVEITVE